jgi:hypothetical protein
MPQLDVFFYPMLITWFLVFFTLTTYIFYSKILPRIFAILKTRKLLTTLLQEKTISHPVAISYGEDFIPFLKILDKRTTQIKTLSVKND